MIKLINETKSWDYNFIKYRKISINQRIQILFLGVLGFWGFGVLGKGVQEISNLIKKI